MGFSRQEYWSGLPCPPPGDLPDPGIEPTSLMSPAWAGGFFTTTGTGKPLYTVKTYSVENPSPSSNLSTQGDLDTTGVLKVRGLVLHHQRLWEMQIPCLSPRTSESPTLKMSPKLTHLLGLLMPTQLWDPPAHILPPKPACPPWFECPQGNRK